MKKGFIQLAVLLSIAAALLGGVAIYEAQQNTSGPVFGDIQPVLPVFKKLGNAILPRSAGYDFALGSATATSSAPLSWDTGPNTLTVNGFQAQFASSSSTPDIMVSKNGSTFSTFNVLTGKSLYSGTNAATAIQTGINAIPSTGGLVFIKTGIYPLGSTQLTIATSHLIVAGDGDGTQLTYTGSGTTAMIAMADTTARSNIQFKDFRCTNVGTANNGICLNLGHFDVTRVSNIVIDGNPFGGILASTSDTFYDYIDNVRISQSGAGNNSYGIAFGNGANMNTVDVARISPASGSASVISAGVIVDSQGVHLNSVDVETKGTFGILVNSNARQATITNAWLEGNKTNLQINSGARSTTVYSGELSSGTVANITDASTGTAFINPNVNFASLGITLSGTASISHYQASGGTVNLPGFNFSGDTNTGLYDNGGNVAALSAGGVGVSWTGTRWSANIDNNATLGTATQRWSSIFGVKASISDGFEAIGYASASKYFSGGLTTCGDSSHGLSYSSATGLFACQSITGSGITAQSGVAANQLMTFQSSTVASGAAGLTWDTTNKRLAVGQTKSPITTLEIGGTASASLFKTGGLGTVTTPAYFLPGGAGLYSNSGAALTNGTNGVTWTGSAWQPNTDAARTLGIISQRWNNIFSLHQQIQTGTASPSFTSTGALASSSLVLNANNSNTQNKWSLVAGGLSGVDYDRFSIQNNSVPIFEIASNSHVISRQATKPTITCTAGSPTVTAGSTDNAGQFVAGAAATSCTVTFNTPYAVAPACTAAVDGATGLALGVQSSTTTVILAATGLGGDTVSYICMGFGY